MLIFSSCKQVTQRVKNAVRSWQIALPSTPIMFFGREAEHLRAELGVYCREVERNEYGTPLLNKMILWVQKKRPEARYLYINSDILLFSDFAPCVEELRDFYPEYLVTGRRTDVEVHGPVVFDQPFWEPTLRGCALAQGKLAKACGADYFLFTRGMYQDMPPFALGRTTFDNWMIYDCLMKSIPVIDISPRVLVVHQKHPVNADSYTGPEAVENQRLTKEMYPDWTPWKGWVSEANLRMLKCPL